MHLCHVIESPDESDDESPEESCDESPHNALEGCSSWSEKFPTGRRKRKRKRKEKRERECAT